MFCDVLGRGWMLFQHFQWLFFLCFVLSNDVLLVYVLPVHLNVC